MADGRTETHVSTKTTGGNRPALARKPLTRTIDGPYGLVAVKPNHQHQQALDNDLDEPAQMSAQDRRTRLLKANATWDTAYTPETGRDARGTRRTRQADARDRQEALDNDLDRIRMSPVIRGGHGGQRIQGNRTERRTKTKTVNGHTVTHSAFTLPPIRSLLILVVAAQGTRDHHILPRWHLQD